MAYRIPADDPRRLQALDASPGPPPGSGPAARPPAPASGGRPVPKDPAMRYLSYPYASPFLPKPNGILYTIIPDFLPLSTKKRTSHERTPAVRQHRCCILPSACFHPNRRTERGKGSYARQKNWPFVNGPYGLNARYAQIMEARYAPRNHDDAMAASNHGRKPKS